MSTFFSGQKIVLRLGARTEKHMTAVKAGTPPLSLVVNFGFMYELLIGKRSTELNRADHGDHFHVYNPSNGSQLRKKSQRGVIW